jgi:hypothetical protein
VGRGGTVVAAYRRGKTLIPTSRKRRETWGTQLNPWRV